MATFDLLSSDVVDAGMRSPLVALANGGFACVMNVFEDDESKLLLVTFKRTAGGDLVRQSEARLDTVFPSLVGAGGDITLRETSDHNILVMHDASAAQGDDFNNLVRGLVVTPGGAPVGSNYVLAEKELDYQFFTGKFDFDVLNPSQVMLVSRFDEEKSDIFYDLYSYDSLDPKPTLTLQATFDDLSDSTVYVFDDGSIYEGNQDLTFSMKLLRHNEGTPPPDWKLPDTPQKVFAVGNRMITAETTGAVLSQTVTVDFYERGEADPVATAKLSHAGEGAAGNLLVTEISGIGFAVLHAVETKANSREFVDIFDFDGDLIKTFKLDAAFASAAADNGGVEPLAFDFKDRIEMLYAVPAGEAGSENAIAATVKVSAALDLDGTAQDDLLKGLGLDDNLIAFEGDDLLFGRAGADDLDGGDGDDFVDAGTGNDTVHAGKGDDAIVSDSGDDTIFGQDGKDIVKAADGDIFVRAGEGDDQVTTGNGKDDLDGDSGDDTINAGKGNDRLEGGSGDDTLRGGAGNDKLFAGEGKDSLNGGDGKDIFTIGKGDTDGIEIADFSHGADKIKLTGFAGLNSFRKLEIFEVDEGTAVQLGKEEDAPLLTLIGVNGLQASDFLF